MSSRFGVTQSPERDPAYTGQALSRGNMVADPHQGGVYWALGMGSGVWKSTDSGLTWNPKNRGLARNLSGDYILPDGDIPGRLTLVLSGSNHTYRSTDGGENWAPAAVCAAPWSSVMQWTSLSESKDTFGAKSLWATKLGIQSNCGHLVRSLDGGDSWCAYVATCTSPAYRSWLNPLCPSGVGDSLPLGSNDGIGAVGVSGTMEAMHFDGKNQLEWPCKSVFRAVDTNPSVLHWADNIDEWTGPVASPARCNGPGGPFRNARLWQATFDPDNPDYRFAGLNIHHVGNTYDSCNLCGPCGPAYAPPCDVCDPSYPHPLCPPTKLWDLSIAYHDGTVNANGRREWKSALDYKTCFGIPDAAGAGAQIAPMTLVKDATAGKKGIFSLGAVREVLWCDASSSTRDCFNEVTGQQNWQCIWNFHDLPGCAALTCPIGPVLWGGMGVWWGGRDNGNPDLAVSPKVNTAGYFDLLFKGRRLTARDEMMRVAHDGIGWNGTHLRDPITCEPSGLDLLTPLQFFEADPSTLVAVTQRQWARSTNGGTTWTADNPFYLHAQPVGPGPLHPLTCSEARPVKYEMWQRAPIVARSPSNPDWIYALHGPRMWLSESAGAVDSWAIVEQTEEGGSGKGCLGDWDSCTPLQQGLGCVADNKRCGRLDRICGDINDIAVDPDDPNTVYAATESGLWKWTWVFVGGPDPCKPNICKYCLTEEGQAYSGRQWEKLQPSCGSGLCIGETPFLSIARHPTDPLFFLGGGRDGLYESSDGGATWAKRTDVASTLVYETLFVPGTDVVFAATEAGVYRKASLVDPFVLTLGVVPVRDVAIDASGPSLTVYAAGVDWDSSTYLDGVYKSVDGGVNWSKVVATQDNQKVMSVFVKSDGTVFAGLLGGGILALQPFTDLVECGYLARKEAVGSVPGAKMGTALTSLGDVPTFPKPDCDSEWAALEFQPVPLEARVRVLNERAFDLRPPINLGVPLLAARGSLIGIGDYDGDGCVEIAVGLPSPATGSGLIQIVEPELAPLCGHPAVALPGPGFGQFGTSLARRDELLAVGAPDTVLGRAYVYSLTTNPPTLLQTILAPAGDDFGWSVALGDFNGVGQVDLAVGAPDVDPSGTVIGFGTVYIYDGDTSWSTLLRTIPGTFNAGVGFSLSSGYDRRGPGGIPDGNEDLAIGAPGEAAAGAAYWYGSASDPAPLRVAGEQPGDLFGFSVLLTRDATADLLPDLLVGAPGNTHAPVVYPEQGAVYLFEATSTVATCKMPGTATDGALGWALAEAGDVDKSRTADPAFGQPGAVAGTAFLRRVLR